MEAPKKCPKCGEKLINVKGICVVEDIYFVLPNGELDCIESGNNPDTQRLECMYCGEDVTKLVTNG